MSEQVKFPGAIAEMFFFPPWFWIKYNTDWYWLHWVKGSYYQQIKELSSSLYLEPLQLCKEEMLLGTIDHLSSIHLLADGVWAWFEIDETRF